MKTSKLCTLVSAVIIVLLLSACDGTKDETPPVANTETAENQMTSAASTDEKVVTPPSSEAEAQADTPQFKTVEWTDLMPKEDLDALLNPPDYINDIADGSVEDQISSQVQNALNAASDDRYQQALVSTRVKSEMDGQAIRIPGFIVPLEFNDDQTISQFFLVPFFGACIHVPPPPPNQIIFIRYPEGLKLEGLYDPFWISGVLKTSLTENAVATSAYSLEMYHYEPYAE